MVVFMDLVLFTNWPLPRIEVETDHFTSVIPLSSQSAPTSRNARRLGWGDKSLRLADVPADRSLECKKERGITTHHFSVPSFPIPRHLIFDSHAPFRQDAEVRG
jgi:hypothetical protein